MLGGFVERYSDCTDALTTDVTLPRVWLMTSDAASTTDDGSWFQASMTLCEKKCFLMFSLLYCLYNMRSCPRNSWPFDQAGSDAKLTQV